MRSPKTPEELKQIIFEMKDRERFVFPVSDVCDHKGFEIEFYLTIRRDTSEPQANLYYQFRDELGVHHKGMDKGNKRLSLIDDAWIRTYFSWIK
jgi:hypothetical protein